MNRIIYTGRLAADPELRETRDGKAVTSVRFGHSVTSEVTEWVTLVAWEDEARKFCASLRKGMLVTVDGRLRVRERTAKDGVKRTECEITVTDFDRHAPAPTIQPVEVEEGELPF